MSIFKGFIAFLTYFINQRDMRIESMLIFMKILKFFSCCYNYENSKLLKLKSMQLKLEMAKTYPFKFQPVNTKLQERKVSKFSADFDYTVELTD